MTTVEQSVSRPSASAGTLLMLILISAPLQALLFTCPGPVLTMIKRHFEAEAGLFGAQMIMSTPGLGIILGGWAAGRLVERFGAQRILAFALPLYALCGAAGLVLDSLGGLLLSRLLQGGATAFIAGSALALVAEGGAGSQPRLLSWQAFWGALAGLASLPLAGWLGETRGWHGPFVLYLSPLLFWLLALPQLMRASVPRVQPLVSEKPRSSTLHLWPLLLAVTLIFAAIFMRTSTLPFLMAEAGVVRPMPQSWMLTLGCLTNALGALSFIPVARYLSPLRCLSLCLLVFGAGDILLGASHTVAPLLIGASISSAAGGFAGPCLAHILLDRAGPALHKAASGLLFTAIYLGDFINPMLTALLCKAFEMHGVYTLVGGLLVAGSVLLIWRRKGSRT